MNPHTKTSVIGVLGLITGILTMVVAYFHSGTLPSGADIAGLLSGAGISVASIVGWLWTHLGLHKLGIPVPSAPAAPSIKT